MVALFEFVLTFLAISFFHIFRLISNFSEFPFFSSRTLFIGNLEKITTYEDLRRQFFKYGKILKIDLKKVRGVTQYAFIQFANLEDARRAVHKMQGKSQE